MKLYKVSSAFRRLLTVLLITLLVFGGISLPVPQAAKAAGTTLASSPEQDARAAAMGLSTEQPTRLSPSGEVVDKSKSPLGSNLVVMNKIYQLGLTRGSTYSTLSPLVLDTVFTGDLAAVRSSNPIPGSMAPGAVSWPAQPYQQVGIGADVDGNGQQELVSIGLITNGLSSKLQTYVTDYNQLQRDSKGTYVPQTSDLVTLDSSVPINGATLTQTSRLIKAVAGNFDGDDACKEEVAILVNGKLYIYAPSMTGGTLITSRSISGISDMEALDTNKNGFSDLVLAVDGRYMGSRSPSNQAATLQIYSGGDYATPTYTVSLGNSEDTIYSSAQVEMGNVLGDGEVIVISSGLTLTYLLYDPVTETYSAPLQFYNLYDETTSMPNDGAVEMGWDLKCASLGLPTPGNPEYVTTGGFLFLYDKTTQTFKLQTLSVTTDSDFAINSVGESQNNITNADKKQDDTYIFEVLVGNFDGNTEGKEQIIMLHLNDWHRGRYLYLTGVRLDGTTLRVHLGQQWKGEDDSSNYIHWSISASYILNKGVKLEFLPDRSTFAFADPVIMAVLGASPFYEELEDEYVVLGEGGTTFGTGTEVSTNKENTFSATAGVSLGFHQSVGMFGVELFSVDVESKFSASFNSSWGTGTSISKSYSFTSFSEQDGVVLMVVPYDIYVYRVTGKNSSGQLVDKELVVEVPYEPRMTMMPLTTYNQRAASISGAPIITAGTSTGVLRHTIGDPRTYPTQSAGLSNLTGDDAKALLATIGNAAESTAFVGCGSGAGISEQSIDSTHTDSKTFGFSLSYELEFSVAVAGVSVGFHGGVEYGRTVTTTIGKTTTRRGSVASVPTGYEQFEFNWALVIYNYQLTTGSGGTQKFPVVSYLVKMDGEFPPRLPGNLRLDSQGLGENVIKWDLVQSSINGYRLLRSTAPDHGYAEIANLNALTFTYADKSDLEPNHAYYYKIWAYNSKDAAKSAALPVTTLYVTGMSVSVQPKLTYEEGETLDLSTMVVTLNLNNDTTKQVAQADFGTDITTSHEHESVLTATDSGSAITVRYVPGDRSVNTKVLTINASSPYDLGASVVFKVGSTNNATALVANLNLEATVSLTNKTTTAQSVLVILALYSDTGHMVQMTHANKSVAASGTDTATLSLTLPASVSGYTAKVITWDGSSLTATTLTPKAPTARIPN